MEMNLEYLLRLGYSEQEVEEYSKEWNENIISYLAENSGKVEENMRYLQEALDRELLMKLPVFYPNAFTLAPNVFVERIGLLKQAFPDEWADIIEKQFWGYDGVVGTDYQPVLAAIGSYDEKDIADAIAAIKNPGSHTYEFMSLLKKETGIEVSVDAVSDDLLLTLEMDKYMIVENAKAFVEKGFSNHLIEEVFWYSPLLMTCSVTEVERELIRVFGEDYVQVMKKAEEDDTIGEMLAVL